MMIRTISLLLVNKGNDFYLQGEYYLAIYCYRVSLKISQSHHLQELTVLALNGLGNAFCALNQYEDEEVEEYYQQSIDISREIGDRIGEGNTLNNLGYMFLKAGRLQEAENILRHSMKVKESLRVGLKDAHKVSMLQRQSNTYRLLQEVLILQNKFKDALVIAEQGRARVFMELLSQRLATPSVDEDMLTPLTLQKIQKIAQAQKSTVVEYSIIYNESGEESDFLYIWVINTTGEVGFRQVELKPLKQQNTSLSDLVSLARKSLGINDDDLDTVIPTAKKQAIQFLRQLYKILIQPIADLLPDNPEDSIIFIPQGVLFFVPFPALQDATGKFLIEQHTILTAPSIQVLDLTSKRQQYLKDEWASNKDEKKSDFHLVVGNPTMPSIAPEIGQPSEQLPQLQGAEAQARTIAELLNTQPIIRDEATKLKLVQRMPSARIIHLATHGLLDDIRELGVPGAIALAPTAGIDNGFLTAGEILELKLKAELVVLSACLTGLGKITEDGVIGLSRCLFIAGVPSVIVSLWSVPDESTQYLMTEFYDNYLGGMNKAKALRQAILATKEKFRSPVNWAGFTLIGEVE